MRNYKEIVLVSNEAAMNDGCRFVANAMKQMNIAIPSHLLERAAYLIEQGNDVSLCVYLGKTYKEVVHVSILKNVLYNV